jgi:hypothetical protein
LDVDQILRYTRTLSDSHNNLQNMCQPQGDAFEKARDSRNAMFRIDALPRYSIVVPDSRNTYTDKPCGSAYKERFRIHGCCGLLNGHDSFAGDNHRLYTRLSDF